MTTAAFTLDDVKSFAEMIRPHLSSLTTNELLAAGRAAWTEANDEMAHQNTRVDAYVDALLGTYDEFRAEAVA